MRKSRIFRFPIVVGSLAILLITVPYLVAWQTAGDRVFGGFLFNPIDGNTYLAKMYQGGQGEWRFQLPYTAGEGGSAYLFLFYLALGHFARMLGITNITMFHVARVAAASLMFVALYRYCAQVLAEQKLAHIAFGWLSLGSGLGWIALAFGQVTPDLWVPEAYPFLSAFTNPHFPLGLALILFLLTPPRKAKKRQVEMLFCFGGAAALGLVLPFGVVLVTSLLGWAFVLAKFSKGNGIEWGEGYRFWSTVFGGVPLVLYQYVAVRSDPVLSGWNAQNITLTPPLWEVLVAFAPAIFLAVLALWKVKGDLPDLADKLVVFWALFGMVLIYIPFNLQRRFMTGLYLPLVVLAVVGLRKLLSYRSGVIDSRLNLLALLCVGATLPTNGIILTTSLLAVQNQDPLYYLHQDEVAALAWLEANTPKDAVVLASPEMGLFIPAHTGRQVIYGHPFETVNADQERAAVERFLRGELSATRREDFLADKSVDYVFFGPREKDIGLNTYTPAPFLRESYQMGEVTIYAVVLDE